LLDQLAALPEQMTAVYVEWSFSYSPEPKTRREVEFLSLCAFGFSALSKASFDCSNPDHLQQLGDFIWEGPESFQVETALSPKMDWTSVLKKSAADAKVRKLARGRNLLLLVGYHDDAVFDVS
jgi:hypothetical protein